MLRGEGREGGQAFGLMVGWLGGHVVGVSMCAGEWVDGWVGWIERGVVA